MKRTAKGRVGLFTSDELGFSWPSNWGRLSCGSGSQQEQKQSVPTVLQSMNATAQCPMSWIFTEVDPNSVPAGCYQTGPTTAPIFPANTSPPYSTAGGGPGGGGSCFGEQFAAAIASESHFLRETPSQNLTDSTTGKAASRQRP